MASTALCSVLQGWERKLGSSSGQRYILIHLCLLCFSWESPILSWWSVTSISSRMRIKHEWKVLSSKCSRGNSHCSQPEDSVLSCCCKPPGSTQTKCFCGLWEPAFHSSNLVKAEINVLEAWPCVPLQLSRIYNTHVWYHCIISNKKDRSSCSLLSKLEGLISPWRHTMNLPEANICCKQMHFHALLVWELQNSVKRNSNVFSVLTVLGSVILGWVSLGP